MNLTKPGRSLLFVWLAATGSLSISHASIFQDTTYWSPWQNGGGMSVVQQSDGFKVTFDSHVWANSLGEIGAGYESTMSMVGDFTVDLDFKLNRWPDANGVRVGIGIAPWYGANRASIPWTGETYAFSSGGATYFVQGSQTSGTLRMVRHDNTFSGYFLNPTGAWTLIGSGSATLFSYHIFAGSWTGTADFNRAAAPIMVELSNLRYVASALIVPGGGADPVVPEPSTYLAGALLLLPLGLGALGSVRNGRLNKQRG